MEGMVEGDGVGEGSENLNLLPSTSSSIGANAPDMATSSSTITTTNPSSSGTQVPGGGVNCNLIYYNSSIITRYLTFLNINFIHKGLMHGVVELLAMIAKKKVKLDDYKHY